MKLVRLLLLPLILIGGGLFIGASPAAADRVEQYCTTQNEFQICISYNYSTSTVAANVQNQASYSRNTFVGLVRAPYHPWLAKTTKILAPGEWRGLWAGPIFQGNFCASADIATQTVIRYHTCHYFS
jgi:hypothetical protein